MKVINKSRKIIAIAGEPLLPGNDMELPEGYDKHPSIVDYLKSGVLADTAKANIGNGDAVSGMSDEERAKIAEDAINQYKAEQEALAAAQAKKEADIKSVKSMKKKEDLILKAMGMGIEVSDSDSADIIKEKILDQLDQ